MSYPVLAPDVQPCVWMCAGVIRYWLCDRDFDCEACPLDVALRSRPAQRYDARRPNRSRVHLETPRDRLYGPGHTWVQPRSERGEGTCRLGLDAFAAAIIGDVSDVRPRHPGQRLARRDALCDLQVGSDVLRPRSPVSGRVVDCNPDVRTHPRRVTAEPYGKGWIVELTDVDPEELLALSGPTSGQEHADTDLTAFRREVACRLLCEPVWQETSRADERPWTDLRRVFGDQAYMSLVRHFIH